MKQKLRLAFLPFLLTLSGLILVYTLLHWLILIRFELFSIKEITSNLVVPMIISGLVALIVVRPMLKLLQLKKNRTKDLRAFYIFICWIILTVPLVIAQEYLVTATGKLTVLRRVSEIDRTPPTKYYQLKSFYTSKRIIGVHPNFEVSGKSNQSFNMHIYVALPIFDSPSDTAGVMPRAWLGFSYHKTISNRLEPAQKEERYKQFAGNSERDFASKNVNSFIYFDRPGNSDDRDGFLEAIRSNPVYQPSKTILVGVNEPFEARNGHKLLWLLGSALLGSLVWLVMVLIPKFADHEFVEAQKGQPVATIKSELKPFWEMMRLKAGFLVTPVLIYINTAIYALMATIGLGFISFKGQDLLHWGANYRPLVRQGEWWRLMTNTFLHGGLMHLLANMYGLLFIGIFLEPVLGTKRFLSFYLLSGVLASAVSIVWYPATVSVGASGAIFGLYGVFLALLLTKIFSPEFAKTFLVSTLIFIGFNLLAGLAGGIDNAAHVGGLISGFLIGLLYRIMLPKSIAE